MPPSQLKRLKTSLRETGVTGPQKSKKQKKAVTSSTTTASRVNRNTALTQIRHTFSPYEYNTAAARPAKFPSVSHATANATGKRYRDVLTRRPGVSKAAGEEARRKTLLPEMRGRGKVGGVVDRRIGEGDAGMTAEERAVVRFAREKRGGGSMFDLEGSDDEGGKMGLTHLGRELDLGAEDDVLSEGDGSGSDDGFMRKKRPREVDDDGEGAEDETEAAEQQPERKKSKKEVMTELIAKSKQHKYERQKTKEDDDDLREELDKGTADVLALLQGYKPPPPPPTVSAKPPDTGKGVGVDGQPVMNADRMKLLDGMDRAKADKEYEMRLRQLAQDTRAKPADRTKTAEEKSQEKADKTKSLEEAREKRMRGEIEEDSEREEKESSDGSEDGEPTDDVVTALGNVGEDDDVVDEAAEFGFKTSDGVTVNFAIHEPTIHDDEDQFDMDEDLVASDSEAEPEASSDEDATSDGNSDVDPTAARDVAEDDEFVTGILGPSVTGSNAVQTSRDDAPKQHTYPCPQCHDELLSVMESIPLDQQATVVQRIRAQYLPQAADANKAKMSAFACALVDHLAFLAQKPLPLPPATLATIESLTRHVHSLSRTYALEIAGAFRRHLQTMHESGEIGAGDLVILMAIGTVYPTSDLFHQVVTPAATLIGRWLALNILSSGKGKPEEAKSAKGAYLVRLVVNWQRTSGRVVPEALRFTQCALKALGADRKACAPHTSNVLLMAECWSAAPAFTEMFTPCLNFLDKKSSVHLQARLASAHQTRRPLELHHHRAVAIRSSIPKFEESFNPHKHYDPDAERSASRKLAVEYKREKKGAVRELRKDASFVAREQLKTKRAKDEEHEKRERRFIAEIQS